ncbi:hypothetical protein DYB37_002716 [Aphanomyces astaci]|uniref:SAM domain-containing protein n=2 Tax=Aphanomyces astaci TaxID=112090 RepID=A0A3R6Y5A7_APHAT|nr:hypothetical protein DYB35_002011 [Aphanomyces astaci]RHZ19910.1 hypothetical protein DYB37_002716 [Aphanomyces astaci]
MGVGLLSKPADVAAINYDDIRVAPSTEVAQWFDSLGHDYHEYATATLDHGIDGPLLRSLSSSDLPILIEALGVTNPLHVRLVATFFHQFKFAQRTAERPEPSPAEQHQHQHTFKPKGMPMAAKHYTPFRKTTLAVPSPSKQIQHTKTIRSKSEAFISVPDVCSDYQAYFSYVVGPDDNGNPIKDRVGAIHALLIAKFVPLSGIVVWFDSEKAVPSPKLIDQGLLHASVVIVFLTRSYMNQVNGDGVMAASQYEFTMALRHQTMSHMVFCVLEEDMMRYDSLTGEFRELVGDAACMDFTDDSFLDEACDELVETINRLDSTKDDFAQPNNVARWGVSALIRFLKQPTTPPDFIDEILHALVTMSLQTRLAEKMVTKGMLPLVLNMLKLHQHNSTSGTTSIKLQWKLLMLLLLKVLARTNAVSRRKTISLVQDMALLPVFLDLLKDGRGAAKENAAGMLRNIFGAGERMSTLPDVTTSEPFKSLYEAASALSACAGHRDFQTLIVRANGIRICLVQIMKVDINECVRDHVAIILRCLSGTEANQREIGSEGGVEAFLTLLETGSTGQRETSAAALNWLMEVEDNRCILAGDGGIPTLLKFIKTGTLLEPCLAVLDTGVDSQKTAAAHVLVAIASTDKVDAMAKAIPIMVKLFYRGSTAQKRLAVDVLSKLGRRKQFKQIILGSGIPEDVLALG